MLRFVLSFALLLLAPSARAQDTAAFAQCETAIAAAEHAETLPPGLLGAIGRVESGRFDPAWGGERPWPWSIDADGTSQVFDTKEAAIAATRSLLDKGVHSIDVGCLQVNLQYHPEAFASLEQAFDPAANAAYAARFLRALFAESLDWSSAAASYHSRTPELGTAYRQLVLAAWGVGVAPPAGRGALQHAEASLPTAPLPPARPFALSSLSVGLAEYRRPGSETRLLALAATCADIAPAAHSSWIAPGRAPGCGRSVFATPSLLRRALAAE